MTKLLCGKCSIRFHSFIEYTNHRCYTVQEWKKLATNTMKAQSNDYQFFNHKTGRIESYDHITTAEILLTKHIIYIRDHKKKLKKLVKVPLKEQLKFGLKTLPSKITAKNFDNVMKSFDKGMTDFSKQMDQMTSGLGGDKKSNKKNLDMLWGNTKSKSSSNDKSNHEFLFGSKKKSKPPSLKLYSEPVKTKKTRRKSSSNRDNRKNNVDILWGKKR